MNETAVDNDGAISVEQLMSGEPIPMEAFRQSVIRLTVSQRLAIASAQAQAQAAQAVLVQVMRECGLDPNKKYNITNEGATVKE